MKALDDEMASVGKPLTDDDMVSYVLAGLEYDYMPFVSMICANKGEQALLAADQL